MSSYISYAESLHNFWDDNENDNDNNNNNNEIPKYSNVDDIWLNWSLKYRMGIFISIHARQARSSIQDEFYDTHNYLKFYVDNKDGKKEGKFIIDIHEEVELRRKRVIKFFKTIDDIIGNYGINKYVSLWRSLFNDICNDYIKTNMHINTNNESKLNTNVILDLNDIVNLTYPKIN